jgi:hypothetical protein
MSRSIITSDELSKLTKNYDDEKSQIITSFIKETRLRSVQKPEREITENEQDLQIETEKVGELLEKLPVKPVEKADSYTDRLLKYIPAEVIALYVTFDSIIRANATQASSNNMIYWIIFFFCFFGTILFLRRMNNVKSVLQIIISLGALTVWVFTLGGPFKDLSWYEELYGALLLPAYTFLIPLITPGKSNN